MCPFLNEGQACSQELYDYWTLFRDNFPCGDDAKGVKKITQKKSNYR